MSAPSAKKIRARLPLWQRNVKIGCDSKFHAKMRRPIAVSQISHDVARPGTLWPKSSKNYTMIAVAIEESPPPSSVTANVM